MAQCVTCGTELHPDRAVKYNYCMAPACQEKNLKGLTMVAVGVNKAADQYLILDDQTQDDLASGKFRDQRRGSFGTSVPSAASVPSATPVPFVTPVPSVTPIPSAPPVPSAASIPSAPPIPSATSAAPAAPRAGGAQRARRQSQRRPASPQPTRRAWSKSQEKLALLYNEQGRRPEEIAQKLGLSPYTVTQIILASRNRGKL